MQDRMHAIFISHSPVTEILSPSYTSKFHFLLILPASFLTLAAPFLLSVNPLFDDDAAVLTLSVLLIL